MVFPGFRFSVRFLTVGLAAGAVTVIVILRLTPFKFAVTVSAPFFGDKIVSGNGKYRRLAGFCIFDVDREINV